MNDLVRINQLLAQQLAETQSQLEDVKKQLYSQMKVKHAEETKQTWTPQITKEVPESDEFDQDRTLSQIQKNESTPRKFELPK